MKGIVYALFMFAAHSAHAEQYTCTYMGFLKNEPVIVKYRIDGDKAHDDRSEYAVVKNTDVGVVLVSSFAYLNRQNEKEVGLFGVVIEKPSLKMTRGNILLGESDSSIRHGTCLK